MRAALVLLAALSSPVAAQGIDGAVPEACLAAARQAMRVGAAPLDGVMGCVGRAAEACMNRSGGVTTTLDMTSCHAEETRWWDDRLNEVHARLRDRLAAQGADLPPVPAHGPAETLRERQRAWIAWRDASCAHAANEFHGGSAAGPAHAACMMQHTARQTLLLAQELDREEDR